MRRNGKREKMASYFRLKTAKEVVTPITSAFFTCRRMIFVLWVINKS